MKAKFLSVLLALTMVLSLLPTAVLAADGEDVAKVGGKTYQPLQGAIDAAEDGATVKLLSDIDLGCEATHSRYER